MVILGRQWSNGGHPVLLVLQCLFTYSLIRSWIIWWKILIIIEWKLSNWNSNVPRIQMYYGSSIISLLRWRCKLISNRYIVWYRLFVKISTNYTGYRVLDNHAGVTGNQWQLASQPQFDALYIVIHYAEIKQCTSCIEVPWLIAGVYVRELA